MAAAPIIKAAQVYIDAKYVGQMEESELSFMNNGEQLIAAEAVSESIGVVTTEGSIKSIVADNGSELDLMALTINQTQIVFGFVTNGQAYQVVGKMIKGSITSNVKTGATKGTSNFRGGPPAVVVA